MARLQTSGDISLQDLITFFGGGEKLTDFYRGGGLVPSTRTTDEIEYYGNLGIEFSYFSAPYYYWTIEGSEETSRWNGDVASISEDGTYARYPNGIATQGWALQFSADGIDYYSIAGKYWREVEVVTPINAGVPTSGDISLTDFYGAYDS